MKDTKVELLFLSEDDMVKAGVLDAKKCVDTMEEVMSLTPGAVHVGRATLPLNDSGAFLSLHPAKKTVSTDKIQIT